ncbi:uncharacterized protein [Antedon mediterranea]|uniref:uncharacterized protein n=1 Tax=Antedon mediterranea TaxID=105859 RepID=UPI003AF7818B
MREDMNPKLKMDEVANGIIACKSTGRFSQISYLRIVEEALTNTEKDEHFERVYFSGSYSEGMPTYIRSDVDMMFVLSFTTVCWQQPPEKDAFVVAELYKDEPAYLKLKSFDGKSSLGENLIDKDGYYKSSSFMDVIFKQARENYASSEYDIHGPSLTQMSKLTDLGDTVYCFACVSWPYITDEYFTRLRPSNWPTQELLNNISSLDCLVVAVGRHDSDTKDSEWRLSFSVAETKIIQELPEQFFGCMFALKAIKKKHKLYEPQTPKPFCSYFIKTACLWMCETISSDNTMDLIRRGLDWLISCYQKRYLPHYFIPQQNLIGHLSVECCDDVSGKLKETKDNLWVLVISSIVDGEVPFRTIIKNDICDKLNVADVNTSDDYSRFEDDLLKHTMTTSCLEDFIKKLKNKLKPVTLKLLFLNWMSKDIWPISTKIFPLITSNFNISEIIRNAESMLLPIIRNIKSIVMKGYDKAFETRLYQFLGDLILSVMVCLRNRCSIEDLTTYERKALYYYNLGGEIVYPDGNHDNCLGKHALSVKFHYLMGNDKALLRAIADFQTALPEDEQPFIPYVEISRDENKDLIHRSWKIDDVFRYAIEGHGDVRFSLDIVVYYIMARVTLKYGNIHRATRILDGCLKELKEIHTNAHILIQIIESLLGLVMVMKMIYNGTI